MVHGHAMVSRLDRRLWTGDYSFRLDHGDSALRAGLCGRVGIDGARPWGRVVAIVAAFLCILKIPFGTALAIWTLVTLLGYRNTSLYDQL